MLHQTLMNYVMYTSPFIEGPQHGQITMSNVEKEGREGGGCVWVTTREGDLPNGATTLKKHLLHFHTDIVRICGGDDLTTG